MENQAKQLRLKFSATQEQWANLIGCKTRIIQAYEADQSAKTYREVPEPILQLMQLFADEHQDYQIIKKQPGEITPMLINVKGVR